MSNSLNLTNIKTLLATAYLAGVHDAFEKSKSLDTFSLQKNIDDSLEFRQALITELKFSGIANPESILINAKSKGKELFCKKYPDEMKCKPTPPTNKQEEKSLLASLTSFFTPTNTMPSPSSSVNTNTDTNALIPPSISTNVYVPPPSVATNTSIPLNRPINVSVSPRTPPTNTSIPLNRPINVSMPPSTASTLNSIPSTPSITTSALQTPKVNSSSVQLQPQQPKQPTINASALNPMVQPQAQPQAQSQPLTVGGKRKSR